MIKIGCHLSVSKGFAKMAEEALSINADTLQFFSRNPRGSKAKDIDEKDVEKFLEICRAHNFGKIIAHAPYTLNPCSKDEKVREFALQTMSDDLERLEILGGVFYNFHPGSHVGQGSDEGIRLITETINRAAKKEYSTTILLETMAGKGTEVGRNFEELKKIIDGVDKGIKIGVCMDTCHVFDGGYDIVNDLDGVLAEFDKIIGLEYLKALHLNDSMNPIGSHKDRHQKIGEGYIGVKTFENIVNNKFLKNLPMCLETPNDIDGYRKEIELLRSLEK